MENFKLTVQEAQEMLLMSQSSVYAWIDKGKLQTIEGPSGKFIVISAKEASQIREMNLKSKRNKTAKQFSQAETSFQEIPTINAEIYNDTSPKTHSGANDNVMLKLIGELKELAVDAGKYKQLEIIRNEEKEKVDYWQAKYFEINTELNQKNLEIAALNKQIEELKTLLEKKKAPFSFLGKKLF